MSVNTTELFRADKNEFLGPEMDGMLIRDLGVRSGDRIRVRSTYRMVIFVKIYGSGGPYGGESGIIQLNVRAEDDISVVKEKI